jgi:predicted unusual protein kinase regulating ubiquinone biosynthesis (AarF/ABC1/UbiB family)
MAIRLGGVLIKVGQFLSSRVDVLPQEITGELAGLQDEVPPEDFADIQRVIAEEFGMPLREKFGWFKEEPLAAASFGQAHMAKVKMKNPRKPNSGDVESAKDNEEFLQLVVKVQRPNIGKIIATDLAALQTVGSWLQHYRPIRKRADVPALLNEFERTLYEEIDYLAEGRNAETFAANFDEQDGVLVPKVIWSHTTKRVLTLEDVQGIKINDYEAIQAAGIDRAEVASRLLDTYLQQIFQDGFFHADPHPGNLFVRVVPYKNNRKEIATEWQLTFIDFGMVGRIPPQARAGFRELLIGIGTQDAARVVNASQMLGILLPDADLDLIEKAEEAMFSKFWGKSMTEMSQVDMAEMREYMYEFRKLIYDMPFQVPQDIIFLVRAVGILSGMCTGLNPEFNVWEHIAPYSKQLIAEEVANHREDWLNELGIIARKVIAFPGRIDSILDKLERGKLVVKDPELASEVKQMRSAIRRVWIAVLLIPILISSVFLYLGDEVWLAILFGLGSFALWVWMIFQP